MTREIGDILIQQTVDSDYEIERKVRIIGKIEKLVMASLNIASVIVEKSASKQEQIEEAKQRLEAGETVREVSQDIPERVVRKVSKQLRNGYIGIANDFCCEDASLIENYDLAKKDNFEGWHIHHRLEDDGHTRQDLKDKNLYYNRPAKELIYMRIRDHIRHHVELKYSLDAKKGEESHSIPTRPTVETKSQELPKEDKPVLEVATYSIEDEKMVAMKRLAGLTGLKRAAMAAAIKRYFEDKKTFDDAYKDDPAMKFAYSLDDYINGARYNIEKH